MFRLIIITFAILVFSSSASAKLSNDEIDKLVTKMCDKPDYPHDDIKTISDMRRLADFFRNMDPYERREKCRDNYYSSIGDLRQLIVISEDNVCDEFKIRLIQDYNENYIATNTKAQKLQKRQRRKAPAMIKSFFMHFAYKIATTCKQALLKKIKTTDFEVVDANGQPKNDEKLDRLLHEFVDSFVSSKDADRTIYDELNLPWAMIDDMHVKKKDKGVLDSLIKDCYWDPWRECTRLHIRMNNAEYLRTFQHTCFINLRPAYLEHILAITNLIGLGLYKNDEPLAKELESNKNLRRMFGLTQVCETILRIGVFEDDTLSEGKIIAMTLNSAKRLGADKTIIDKSRELPFKVIYEKSATSPSLVDQYDVDILGDKVESKALVDVIVKNRKRHEDVVKKSMSFQMKRVREQTESKTGGLLALAQFSDNGPMTEVEIEQVYVEKVPLTFSAIKKKVGDFLYKFMKIIGICIVVTLFLAAFGIACAG